MKFLDQAKVFVRSGDGGSGCVSFRREAFIEYGGPDGGDGGRRGDVIVECVDAMNTLIDFRYQQHFKAQNGRPGSGRKMNGPGGRVERKSGVEGQGVDRRVNTGGCRIIKKKNN